MEDTIEVREVKIEGKGRSPHDYKVLDLKTGKMMDDVRGIHIVIGVDDLPAITIEQYHYDGPALNIQARATIKNKDHRFEDKSGRVWLDASELAKMIRDKGSLCWHGKRQAVTCEFSEDILRNWEGKKPAPAVG